MSFIKKHRETLKKKKMQKDITDEENWRKLQGESQDSSLGPAPVRLTMRKYDDEAREAYQLADRRASVLFKRLSEHRSRDGPEEKSLTAEELEFNMEIEQYKKAIEKYELLDSQN